MTQRATIQCVHEPFGDAWYYGPERLASRFMEDPQGRLDSGFSKSTYRTVMDRLEREGSEVCTFSCFVIIAWFSSLSPLSLSLPSYIRPLSIAERENIAKICRGCVEVKIFASGPPSCTSVAQKC